MPRELCGTFLRLGIPAPADCTELVYYPPPGWKLVHSRQLSCGWFTIILQKESTMSTVTHYVCDVCKKESNSSSTYLIVEQLQINAMPDPSANDTGQIIVDIDAPITVCGQQCFHEANARILAEHFAPEEVKQDG